MSSELTPPSLQSHLAHLRARENIPMHEENHTAALAPQEHK